MSTVYTDIDPAGLGATLERAYSPGTTRVVVCGPRPGAGKTGAERWASESGRWLAETAPHITRSSFRGRYGRGGVSVNVTRAEPWFGRTAPAAVVELAAPVVRHALGKHGQVPMQSPGRTGLALLARLINPAVLDLARTPFDVAELLRETSGQGRFQMLAPVAAGTELVGIDARFQYGALALAELPSGRPYVIRNTDPDAYAPSWCKVWFKPEHCHGIGALGTHRSRNWEYPTDGEWFTWCSGAELHEARRMGYRVKVLEAVVWPERARPLAPMARAIISEREHIDRMPLPADVRKCAAGALRSVLVQTVGSLHRGWSFPSASATAETEGSAYGPEWTTALYALGRARLLRRMVAQDSPVVACALDGLFVAGAPVLDADNGKPGQWIESGRFVTQGDVLHLGHLYREQDQ